MSRLEAWFHHLANLLVGGSGLVYAWMLYVLEPPDEFSVVSSPLQPWVQQLHIVSAPLLVFSAGLIWKPHAWKRVRAGFRPRRRTGLVLVVTLLPMVLSGYFLQTAAHPAWRTIWLAVHLTASGLWVAGYLAHQLGGAGGTQQPESGPVRCACQLGRSPISRARERLAAHRGFRPAKWGNNRQLLRQAELASSRAHATGPDS